MLTELLYQYDLSICYSTIIQRRDVYCFSLFSVLIH